MRMLCWDWSRASRADWPYLMTPLRIVCFLLKYARLSLFPDCVASNAIRCLVLSVRRLATTRTNFEPRLRGQTIRSLKARVNPSGLPYRICPGSPKCFRLQPIVWLTGELGDKAGLAWTESRRRIDGARRMCFQQSYKGPLPGRKSSKLGGGLGMCAQPPVCPTGAVRPRVDEDFPYAVEEQD